MLDPQLSELLNKKEAEVVDPDLDQAISEEIDALIENTPPGSDLLTPDLKRKKLEQEIRNDPVALELKKHISLAINILTSDERLLEELTLLGERLDDQNLNLELSAESSQIIQQIGIKKYEIGLIDESLAIFHFLCLVNRSEPDYWFRLGLIARQCANYPLALRALNTASDLAPTFIGSHLYAALCHLEMHSKENALTELALAKELPSDAWKDELNEVIRRTA